MCRRLEEEHVHGNSDTKRTSLLPLHSLRMHRVHAEPQPFRYRLIDTAANVWRPCLVKGSVDTTRVEPDRKI